MKQGIYIRMSGDPNLILRKCITIKYAMYIISITESNIKNPCQRVEGKSQYMLTDGMID